jgi:hypothetical protein
MRSGINPNITSETPLLLVSCPYGHMATLLVNTLKWHSTQIKKLKFVHVMMMMMMMMIKTLTNYSMELSPS